MSPQLVIFRSLWTNGSSLQAALNEVTTGLFDGVEGPLPSDPSSHSEFITALQDAGAPYILEVATGGGYVPHDRSLTRHLDELQRMLDVGTRARPMLATVLGGCDSWPIPLAVEFIERAIASARDHDLAVSFETHRARPTFNPWATAELLRQVPALRLTCDFSHWCCVTERLVLEDEPELLRLIVSRAEHIHARVGYAQGPQVPHPAAPEFRPELQAHEKWWEAIAAAKAETGAEFLTVTPEFGPDGYLQAAPFSGHPVASLDEINCWMATRLRSRFGANSESLVTAAKGAADS